MPEQKFDYDVIGKYLTVLVRDETITTDKSICALAEELTMKYSENAESISIYHRDKTGLIDLSLRIILGQ